MMLVTKLTLAIICVAVALPANDVLAQQRLVFKVAAENTQTPNSTRSMLVMSPAIKCASSRFAAPIPATHR